MEFFNKKNIVIFIILILFSISLGINIYQQNKIGSITNHRFQVERDNDLINNIESYLDQLSPSFVADINSMVKQYNISSWGCGPTSFALAKILNSRFFNDKLIIDATYDNNQYEIIERFGFVQVGNSSAKLVSDHAWLEIYINSRILFIDPTIAQYGKASGIVYKTFRVGDPNMRSFLKDNYGIIDDRISKLVWKMLSKLPISSEPYPGFAINPSSVSYYIDIDRLRDLVNINQEPDEWKFWVDPLVKKYGQSS